MKWKQDWVDDGRESNPEDYEKWLIKKGVKVKKLPKKKKQAPHPEQGE